MSCSVYGLFVVIALWVLFDVFNVVVALLPFFGIVVDALYVCLCLCCAVVVFLHGWHSLTFCVVVGLSCLFRCLESFVRLLAFRCVFCCCFGVFIACVFGAFHLFLCFFAVDV